jgi:uncharacterized protein involved in exopolysaccharide biosynthesis
VRSEVPLADLDARRADDDQGMDLFELFALLRRYAVLLIAAPLLAGVIALGITYLIKPTFTATTVFLPPQQQQSAAAAALAQLGPLAALAGGAGTIRTPADQYVALMQSTTVSDRIIDRFGLMQEYDVKLRMHARKALAGNVRMTVGKKDGLITVAVDDTSPQRAADMANRYVDELREMTSTIAVTEAQQRRVFFEQQLQQTKERLTAAQQALQGSGFSQRAIKAEPRAAAEGYAKLRAEVTAAEVRLQALRGSLADDAPEVRLQQATVSALRAQLARLEAAGDGAGGPDYVTKYREFKYQETLFDLFAKQYELARVDESREGALVQVVDRALPPEWKSKPKRALVAIATVVVVALLLVMILLVRQAWQQRAPRSRPTGFEQGLVDR